VATYLGYLVPLSPVGAAAVALGSIGLMAAVNIGGVRFGSGVIHGLAGLKLAVLGFLILWGLVMGRGDWSNFVPLVARRPGSEPLIGALIGGMIAAFFALGGWWDVSKIAGEVRDPGRNMPRALLLGVLLTTGVYVLICMVFLYLVPAERIGSREAFAALVGEVLFGRSGGVVLSLIVIVTVLGSLAAVLMAMPRVYFAMARDGLFFSSVAAIHPRFRAPARAILIQAGLASLLAVTGSFDEILAYFIVPTVIFLALAVAAVFVARGKAQPGEQPLAIPWYPLPPLLFLAQIVILVVLLILDKPGHSAIGLAIVLLGVPVYHLVFAGRTRRETFDRVSVGAEPATPGMETK
ncbi:MAG: APC family permease, partial [Isosphaeraceae bacterium]